MRVRIESEFSLNVFFFLCFFVFNFAATYFNDINYI